MIIDVIASDVRVGDWLADGTRVEGRRESDGQVRLAVRRPSWRCRKLVVFASEAPVRVERIARAGSDSVYPELAASS